MKPKLAFLLAGAVFAASHLLAQSNATDAAIEGYVFDNSRAGVAAAKVRAIETRTAQEYAALSSESGYYRFPLLPVGVYKLIVAAPGFAPFERTGIQLSVGNQARIDLNLTVAGNEQTVTVTEDSPLVQTGALTGNDGVVTEKAVRNLPVISRNIYNFALLNPGTKGVPSTAFANTIVIFGGNNRALYLTDGLDNSNRLFGAPVRLVISTPESVSESQVLANNYSAEFGKTSGGILNVITTSGTNELHGSAMFLYRPNALAAAPALSSFKPESEWKQTAGSIGGPISKDRIFFFANYEYNPVRFNRPVSIAPDVVTALRLSPEDLRGGTASDFNTLSGKVDFRINDRHRGFVRYNRFWATESQRPGGIAIASRGNGFNGPMNGGAVQLTSILSPNLLNEFRFGASARSVDAPPLGNPPPNSFSVDLSGQASIGNNGQNITRLGERPTQLVNNVTWTRGSHTVKVGIDYTHIAGFLQIPLTQNYTFGGLPAVPNVRPALTPLQQYQATLAGQIDPATQRPYNYTLLLQFLGTPSASLGFHFISAFVQDEFRLSRNLTLHVGGRYDAFVIPTLDANAPYPQSRKVPNDLGNVAPRVGLAWSPFASQKTVFRAGYGLYYDPASTSFLQPAILNGNRVGIFAVPGALPNAPAFGNLLTGSTAAFATAPGVTAFSQSWKTMYAQHANFQWEQILPAGFSMRSGYTMNLQRNLPYQYDINLGNPLRSLADGRPVYAGAAGRPNKQFGAINYIDPGGVNNYHAFDLSLSRRTQSLLFSLNYSWSHAIGDTTLATGSLSDPSNRSRDRGNSPFDIRHSLSFYEAFIPAFTEPRLRWMNGFNLSSTWFYNSGRPVNGIQGTDLNGDTVVNDRPLFQGWNSFTGPAFFQVDARLSRRFRLTERHSLEAIFEAQNVTNHVNADCSSSCTNAVVNVVWLPDFGRLTLARQGRVVQFGVRYAF